MRSTTFPSAIALAGSLILAAQSPARQLGPDSQPNLYTGKQLADPCSARLINQLWAVSDAGKFRPFDPARDSKPTRMQPALDMNCQAQAQHPHEDLPLLIHGSLWQARGSQIDKQTTFYLAKSEWSVYAARHS